MQYITIGLLSSLHWTKIVSTAVLLYNILHLKSLCQGKIPTTLPNQDALHFYNHTTYHRATITLTHTAIPQTSYISF